MGALTLKSFPFELRGWDIEKFESLDPTDGFGTNVNVYINQNQITQIEPDYNYYFVNSWITDKSRQFYDSIFSSINYNIFFKKNAVNNIKKNFWLKILRFVIKNLYIFNHCLHQKINIYFFTIIFKNISLEILSLLIFILKNYNFIKLRRIESYNYINDFEDNFQLNINKLKLSSSNMCLLINSNTRYEGYYLNLKLRQRFFKGNFKCLTIGSLINITFPIIFLGSNFKSLKSIIEGSNLICQNIKYSKNFFLISNDELFKRKDGLNILNSINISFTIWNGLNIFNSILSETGNKLLNNTNYLTSKDLNNFNLLYLININLNQLPNIKKIIKVSLLFNFLNKINKSNKILLNQNLFNLNKYFYNKLNHINKIKYFFLPNNTLFENNETFLNTTGIFKNTNKIISIKNKKNNWKILRNFIINFKNEINFFYKINNNNIYFDLQNKYYFKNFIFFNYFATNLLTNLNYYLIIKSNPFHFRNFKNFKISKMKFYNNKFNYWLNDFFIGGKDDYSCNSLILIKCSKNNRLEQTNFF